MSAVARAVRAALDGRRVLRHSHSHYPGAAVIGIVRLHPDVIRELMLEEGVDPDELLELVGNRLAGMNIVPDITVDRATLVVEAAQWITSYPPVSWATNVHVEQSQTFRAVVTL